MCEYNSTLWNNGTDSGKEQARKQKRKLSYYSNVYVVSDPANPENEGKVFLYKYGKKIHDKIMEAMKAEFADEEPINPFDFWQGANFKLKIRRVEGYQNYDKSEFDRPSALFDDDDKLEKIYNNLHDLNEFLDPKNSSLTKHSRSVLTILLVSRVNPRCKILRLRKKKHSGNANVAVTTLNLLPLPMKI